MLLLSYANLNISSSFDVVTYAGLTNFCGIVARLLLQPFDAILLDEGDMKHYFPLGAYPMYKAEIESTVNGIVQQLIKSYAPQQIILFGSLADGQPHADSDIDLLIIKETAETPLERRVAVRRLAFQPERHMPFSPLVLTPNELAQRLAMGDPFYQEILKRGKVLYADN